MSVLDILKEEAHSVEVKDLGLLGLSAFNDVVTEFVGKYPALAVIAPLEQEVVAALGARLHHLIQHDQEKAAALASVTVQPAGS